MTNILHDYFATIGKKGGKKLLKIKGKEYFSAMGKRSGEKRKKKLSTDKT